MSPPVGPWPGVFITFEGVDGSGKSTQARRLVRHLRRLGLEVVHTREPGGTAAGQRIRRVLLAGRGAALVPEAELLLLAADRLQHVEEVLRPALQSGAVVVCERFADSSVAYQAFGLGVDRKLVEQLNQVASGGLEPDLTLWLDLPFERRHARPGRRQDRIEGRGSDFFERVREGYRALAAEHPHRLVAVEAGEPPDRVEAAVLQVVMGRLGERLKRLSEAQRRAGLGGQPGAAPGGPCKAGGEGISP